MHTIDDAEAAKIQRFLYLIAGGTIGFVVLTLVAVATADKWLMLISAESERRFIEPYLEMADGTLLEPSQAELQQLVDTLAEPLVKQMDLPADLEITIRVIRSDEVNAFTTLGGYIFVTDGLIRALDNNNSLAMVLGHEIAHAKQRDPLLGAGRGMLLGVMLTALSGSGGNPAAIGDLGSELALNVYSRDQERLADRLALAALQGVYGHVGGATQLFQKVSDADGDHEVMELLSTHPHMQERIADLEQLAQQNGWTEGAVQPYADAVVERLSALEG